MSTSVEGNATAIVPAERRPSASHAWERILAVCALVAAILIMVEASGPLLAVFKLTVWLFAPGWVLLRRLRQLDPAARLIGTALVSVVCATVLGLIMAWTGFWYPRPVAVATLLAAASLIYLATRKERYPRHAARLRISRPRPTSLIELIPWFVLAAALLVWAGALTATSTGPLGDLGLLVAFPVTWYIALGLVLALCIWGVVGKRAGSPWIMSASITGLVVILYASAGLLTSVPRLPWVYKHIAVTDYISAGGRIDPSIDIYNRWPGFFSGSAFIGDMIGYQDALAYASWAEVVFALVDLVIVVAIARAMSKNPRVYWTAGLVFTVTNWVGQNYYAPQAFGFTLYLAMCLTALTFLRGTPVKAVRTFEVWLTKLRRRTDHPSECNTSPALRTAAAAAILVIQGIVVVSHQLTPYMAVLGLLPLFAFGFFRPKWLGPVLLAIAIAYLLPNLAYVQNGYGLFSGFDPLSNASSKLSVDPVPEVEKWQSLGVSVLSALTGVLAFAGFVRQFLNGSVRTALIVSWLAVAPAFTLLGQSYGGEGRLRVYLFALPWLAIGVAWLFWSGPSRTRKSVLGATASLVVMAVLFTATYFQPESRNRVQGGDVSAAKWLDARVGKGDLVFPVNSAFPLLVGPNYYHYLRAEKLNTLEGLLLYSGDAVTAGDVEYYLRSFDSPAKVYVVFSESQHQVAGTDGLVDSTLLRRIEMQLTVDGAVEKVLDNGSVRIYLFHARP